MVWDYAEANPISDSSGNFLLGIDQAAKMLDGLGNGYSGIANQVDAASQAISVEKLVSTDPPYYDNIGMAVYTRFSRVLDTEGHALTVREALALINQGLIEASILTSKAGQVRLLEPDELPADWNPETDPRLTVWEMVHHLIRVLEAGGERAAAQLVGKLGTKAESVCELCCRLYTLCERKKRAAEALAYNSLVQSRPEIVRLADEVTRQSEQSSLFDEKED